MDQTASLPITITDESHQHDGDLYDSEVCPFLFYCRRALTLSQRCIRDLALSEQQTPKRRYSYSSSESSNDEDDVQEEEEDVMEDPTDTCTKTKDAEDELYLHSGWKAVMNMSLRYAVVMTPLSVWCVLVPSLWTGEHENPVSAIAIGFFTAWLWAVNSFAMLAGLRLYDKEVRTNATTEKVFQGFSVVVAVTALSAFEYGLVSYVFIIIGGGKAKHELAVRLFSIVTPFMSLIAMGIMRGLGLPIALFPVALLAILIDFFDVL